MRVRQIMHRTVKTCRLDDDLQSVAMIMWNEDCGAVPIVDDEGHAIGLLTDRDIAMAAALYHRPLWDIGAREVKPKDHVCSCRASDDVRVALRTMGEERVRRLLVLSESNRIEGIVALKDVLDNIVTGRNGAAGEPSSGEALHTLRTICRPIALPGVV